VIRLAALDFERPIDLLQQHYSHELVGERERAGFGLSPTFNPSAATALAG
jgi:hypothetical protein